MKFTSTRDESYVINFFQALQQGLAPDGGLFVPVKSPDLRDVLETLDPSCSFQNLSAMLIYSLFHEDFDQDQATKIADQAFPFSPEIIKVAPGINVLELFHGPSCAFKDFGASFLATIFDSQFTKSSRDHSVILTATSGDTGSAVAKAFYGKKNVSVVILYPSGMVSPMQELQLSTMGGNILALEVRGNFDDCQHMVKTAFSDSSLSKLNLTSANSINPGRLLPQSFYYIWSWIQLGALQNVCFVVPSGNFGNITSGLYASTWGMNPVHFLAAVKSNTVFPEYLNSGVYIPRDSISTYSNAMDVGSPSNFERISHLFDHDVNLIRKQVHSFSINDNDTLDTIHRVYRDHDYMCCPHTAVGWKAAELFLQTNPDVPCIVLATAHPSKFTGIVEKATGNVPQIPDRLRTTKKKQSVLLSNSPDALGRLLLDRF